MRWTKMLAAASLCALGSAAEASTADYGYVVGFVTSGSRFLVYTDGTRSTPPACNTAGNRFELDGSTAMGQTNVSILLTTYALHRPVKIVGTGTCNGTNDTELVSLIATDNH